MARLLTSAGPSHSDPDVTIDSIWRLVAVFSCKPPGRPLVECGDRSSAEPGCNRLEASVLEKLAAKRENVSLDSVLLEARYRLCASAEPELERLAKVRQVQSRETYEKAYSEVLSENPHLYKQYLAERETAARGTSFEKSRASSHMRKGVKPK